MASLEKRHVSEFISFVPGINQSRAGKQFGEQFEHYYDQSSFELDYHHEENNKIEDNNANSQDNLSLNEGDMVISNSLQLATIVGKNNVGKVLSLNFTKVEFHSDQLDKRYFLYLFNSFKDVKRQKERELQGSGLIQRIPIKSLEKLIIPVPPLAEQKKIGAIFVETLQLQERLKKYAGLLEDFTSSIIEEQLKEK